jgi:hypothetical protein
MKIKRKDDGNIKLVLTPAEAAHLYAIVNHSNAGIEAEKTSNKLYSALSNLRVYDGT